MRRRSHIWTWARRATALGFFVLLVAGARTDVEWLRGSTTATTLMGALPFADPLAAIQTALATRSVTRELWVGAGILAALAALLGPVFCGWLCPLGFLLDGNAALRERILRLFDKRHRRIAERGAPRGTRELALLFVLSFTVFCGIPFFEAVSPIQLLVRGIAYGAWLGLFVVLGIAIAEWFAPRIWCRTICPTGGLYALLGRLAPLRVRIDRERAGKLHCAQCESHCPMGIPVMNGYTLAGASAVDDPDCTRCGACLDACPGAVLRIGVR
ncbi:MAG: 4Fe-4S binding protein [Planctomycetes bacterium]|nr:4Fe-4S binding protein [Planctomycetota bacterium]MCB9904516.1 4Fe-4S binding protein [Planctomycetota bacterium]